MQSGSFPRRPRFFGSCTKNDFLNLPLNSFIDSLVVCPSKTSDVGLSFLGALPSPCYTGCDGGVCRFQTVAFQSNLFLMASNFPIGSITFQRILQSNAQRAKFVCFNVNGEGERRRAVATNKMK